MQYVTRGRLLVGLTAVVMAISWACGGATPSATPEKEPSPTPAPVARPPQVATAAPLPTEGPEPTEPPGGAETSPSDLPIAAVVVSTDLAVGENRLIFGIIERRGDIVRQPEVKVAFYDLSAQPPERRSETTARFHSWPPGSGGVYVVRTSFDRPGPWGLEVEVEGSQAPRVGRASFIVKQETSAPAVGEPVPASENKTLDDVSDIAELTTAKEPDPDLYRMTVAEAVASGKPTVVSFATPAFCQTATCGPQVEILSALKGRYGGKANFIHVEVFENPHEMEGDISKGRINPILREWGLTTEPFTFVLDRQGKVAARFEGFVGEKELEEALMAALAQ